MEWFDALVQGILLGGMYAQYALGMALMFGVMRIVNISHGDLVILLSLIGISMATAWGLAPVSVLIILVPLAVLMGWLLQKAVLNRVVGSDPLLFLASCTEIPYGVSEYAWVGGLRGEPVPVVRGQVTGLPLPANAEIVFEGYARPDLRLPEGPFGEWTGYYASDTRPEPVLEVEAMYFRNSPILLGQPPAGRKLDFLMQEFMREANTLCSKSATTELTAVGLELKAVIEQLREQVQNVE